MPAKIVTEGVLDGLTWGIICGGFALAVVTQGLKAAGIVPPLALREIIVRSLAAGVTALVCGLLLLGSGKIELSWALYLGLGGTIGYAGQEIMESVLRYVKKKLGLDEDEPEDPKKPEDKGNDEQGGGEA